MYAHWSPQSGRRGRKTQLKRRAKRQTAQLFGWFILFFLVFVGQGVYPSRFQESKDLILSHLGGNQDFYAAFSDLGEAWGKQQFSLQDLGQFCVEVFGNSTQEQETKQDMENAVMVFQPDQAYFSSFSALQADDSPANTETEEFPLLFQAKTQETLVEEPLPFPEGGQMVIAQQSQALPLAEEMAIGTVIASYEGEGENYCYDKLYLGSRQTFSPVYSVVTSPFGTRISPISGLSAVHRGVDLRAALGTEVYSWSDAVVQEVGETVETGLYVKLDHGDEIQTVYAHCSEILVETGQVVAGGECIALSGDTGQVTAAHLHFEILWQGKYLNPLHYFEYEDIL